VGTFGGEVQVIDYVNSKPGLFRILVVPDPDDEPWPKQLRQGSGIKGWIMLNDVPIWYEIWRQLNGFPPSLYNEPLDDVIEKKQKESESNDDVSISG
jgi:membrane fusion protein, adhesin transport system